VFDAVIEAVMNPNKDNRLFCMAGVAGAGKTLIANKIAAKVRRLGQFVKICASTTLAAQLYKFGSTAHKLFDFPVTEDSERDSENPPQCRYINIIVCTSIF
jgi:signal recognition particle GTPase